VGAATSDDQDFPYEGQAGRTKLEPLHVTLPGGGVRSLRVYRAVDVKADPTLREPTLAGALHRFETGEQLALTFVYHDPVARKLAVVVPETMRHEVLRERAKLLQQIASDTDHPVPMYASEAIAVVGLEELRAYLARPPGAKASSAHVAKQEAELSAREAALVKREEELVKREKGLEHREEALKHREERLLARAEAVTSREDELRTLGEEAEAAQRDVTLREAELESRIESLRQRETELAAARKQKPQGPQASKSGRPSKAAQAASQGSVSAADVEDVASDDDDDEEEIEELDELVPIGSEPRIVVPRARRAAKEDATTLPGDAVEELVEGDEVEEDLEDDVQEVTGVGPVDAAGTGEHGLAEAKTMIVSGGKAPPTLEIIPFDDGSDGPAVPPPPSFFGDATVEMVASFVDGSVWLHARIAPEREAVMRDGELDLLAQHVVVQGYPVVLLTLVTTGDERPYVRRAALDPRSQDGRHVLEALRHEFKARVALFGESRDGNYLTTREVSAPREVNVGMVLERVSRAGDPTIDAGTAIERALSVPPPVREAGHPFQGGDAAIEPANAKDALLQLRKLEAWATPDKIDRALLALSVPRDVVDGSVRRVLDAALKFGLALGAPLRSRAVSLGVASEPGELVSRQLESFRKVATSEGRGGLTLEETAGNWERLLADAAENDVAVDDVTSEVARDLIRAVKGDSSGGPPVPDVDPAKLPSMGPPELALLLDRPKLRRLAAIELCKRADPELIDVIYKAVRKMPRSDVVCVVPRVVAFGESAGDSLIDGLGARKTFVRQASALALGHLKLRRAVVPLVALMQSEESDVWQEVARAFGEFGVAGFRTLLRSIKDPKGKRERYAMALAHLTNHGCLANVEGLKSDPDAHVAELAQEALLLRADVKTDDDTVRQGKEVQGLDAIRQFSRRFYQELAGTAPEADLTDAADNEA